MYYANVIKQSGNIILQAVYDLKKYLLGGEHLKKHLFNRKFGICLSILFAIPVLGITLLLLLAQTQVMVYPSFCDIRGLSVRVGNNYDSVIESMGEPIKRETIKRDNASALSILHYDGITFFISDDSKRVIYLDIVSEQYKLGGRRQHLIGIGSTREDVKADSNRRRANYRLWVDRPILHHEFTEPHSLPTAEFGYGSSFRWTFVEFEFDQNDVVIRMRIGLYG